MYAHFPPANYKSHFLRGWSSLDEQFSCYLKYSEFSW